ncbi:MAG: GNAT family protein [Myxococcota bacterium]
MRADRILLRAVEPDDAETLVRFASEATLTVQIPMLPLPVSRQHQREAIAAIKDLPHPERLMFAIDYLGEQQKRFETPQLIGWCALEGIHWVHRSAVLDVMIGDADRRGMGLGTETMLLLLHLGFDVLGLQRIGLSVIAHNTRAIRCIRRLGFSREATRRQAFFFGGAFHDVLDYALLETQWRERHGYELLKRLGYSPNQIQTVRADSQDNPLSQEPNP